MLLEMARLTDEIGWELGQILRVYRCMSATNPPTKRVAAMQAAQAAAAQSQTTQQQTQQSDLQPPSRIDFRSFDMDTLRRYQRLHQLPENPTSRTSENEGIDQEERNWTHDELAIVCQRHFEGVINISEADTIAWFAYSAKNRHRPLRITLEYFPFKSEKTEKV